MSNEPASAHPYASLSLAQMIGLNLAKLYAWLVRYEASGETQVPSEIAHMVTSTDWLVHAFIRMLASQQLDRAGFTFAALAMRVPNCSREPAVHIERAQGCAPISPAELLARLETTMENFERAEAIASALARVIVFTLVYVSSGTPDTIGAVSTATQHKLKMNGRVGLGPPNAVPEVGQGPPNFRPPPYPQTPVSSLEPALCEPKVRESKQEC